MGWDIGSSLPEFFRKWIKHPFHRIHIRLLLSYLAVMSTVLAIMILFVYKYFAHNIYSSFDRQITLLADAAAHSLPKLKDNPNLVDRDRIIDNDGDLDIPWQDMRHQQQTIEWFDIDGKLLAKAGSKQLPSLPFDPATQASQFSKVQQLEKKYNLRSLIVPIYSEITISKFEEAPDKVLIGYVRVMDTSGELEEELEKILWGLGWGGLLAISTSALGGWWLAKQSLQPIEQNYEQMRQFTADASHELRGPLTAIKTSIDVIQSHPERIHENDAKKILAIGYATEQMTHLVEDLLFLARIDNANLDKLGDRALSLRQIPIDELLEDLIEFLEPQIFAKKINLQTNLTDTTVIHCEASQLRRLFINLLENAIAYSPVGGRVTVNLHRRDRFLNVEICDTGFGIAPEDLPYVFGRFWRAEQARSWRDRGTGLGLAIAEAIAKNHGGNITVWSEVDVGSCFTVKLPTD